MSKNTMTMVVVVGLFVVALATIDQQSGKIAELARANFEKDRSIFGLKNDLANARSARDQAEAAARSREAELQAAFEKIAQLTKAAGNAHAG